MYKMKYIGVQRKPNISKYSYQNITFKYIYICIYVYIYCFT